MELKYLFIDMNSYFASVEQELRPELRGKPIAVSPGITPNGVCIAVSYEAKKFGIKTGTKVGDAQLLCPEIIVVEADPDNYVRMHHKIVAAVESCSHVDQVFSIDEMVTTLCPSERNYEKSTRLGYQIKQAIKDQVGSTLQCSVGIASNRFLAKVAADYQKPNGLSVFMPEEIFSKLGTLALRDLPGIGMHMEARLKQAGIYTMQEMLQCSERDLEQVWGGIVGRRWWHHLRGFDLEHQETHRGSISHSHVLAPELRSEDGAYAVLLRLLHKACARLRKINYFTRHLQVSIRYVDGTRWRDELSLAPSQDTLTILESFFIAWRRKTICGKPLKVSCVLGNIVEERNVSLPLFKENENRLKLGQTLDTLNARHGMNTLYVAAMQPARSKAQPRIAFGVIPDVEDQSLR